jgi:alkylated DNA repair dioxygenase AlkB
VLREYGGTITKRGHIPCKLPSWLDDLCERVHGVLGPSFFRESPSHVLLNCYEAGNGIMPHEDGPQYLPVVAILSIGATTIFRFFEKSAPNDDRTGVEHKTPIVSLIVPRNSLLVFRGKYYDHYLHGIDAVASETVDRTVVNAHDFFAVGGRVVPIGSPIGMQAFTDAGPAVEENLHNNAPHGHHPSEWQFQREGTRMSLTMRNAAHKLNCVLL